MDIVIYVIIITIIIIINTFITKIIQKGHFVLTHPFRAAQAILTQYVL